MLKKANYMILPISCIYLYLYIRQRSYVILVVTNTVLDPPI